MIKYIISFQPSLFYHFRDNQMLSIAYSECEKMKIIPFLCCGNHPRAEKMRERVIQIIKILKENKGKITAKELEAKLGISRRERPAMFYKPLAALKRLDLIQVHKKVIFDEKGKKYFETTYELTPEMFYHYIKKTLLELCKKELEML